MKILKNGGLNERTVYDITEVGNHKIRFVIFENTIETAK